MSKNIYSELVESYNNPTTSLNDSFKTTNSNSITQSDDLIDGINDITKLSSDSANSETPFTDSNHVKSSHSYSYNFVKTLRNEIDLKNNVIEYIILTADCNNGLSKGWSYQNSYIKGFELDENSRENVFFLHNEEVKVELVGIEEEASMGILQTSVYLINIKHGDYNWKIKRKFKNILKLYEEFTLFKTTYNIRHPSDSSTNLSKFTSKDHFKLIFLASDFNKSKHTLEKFLIDVLEHRIFRYHNETLKFFEVSHLSFINDIGDKTKEGVIKKRSGGYKANVGCCSTFSCSCCWDKRWLIIKDSFIAYMNPKSGEIRAVMLIDHKFVVKSGSLETGMKNGLSIENGSRILNMKCYNENRAQEWKFSISNILREKIGKEFNDEKQRFMSYSPIRENSMVKWLVDGADYMESIAEAIELAQEEIFIAGFFLSPELYLKRPVIHGNQYRLDYLLKRKAAEGVKIYILLYKEIEMALNINSNHAKRSLFHKNIKILRHPDHMKDQSSILWAHHEKLVIIDQTVAFFGGIDLCYGRWDNHLHNLTDLGSVLPTVPKTQTTFTPPSSVIITELKLNSVASVIQEEEEIRPVDTTKTDTVFDSVDSTPLKSKFLRMISLPAKPFDRKSVNSTNEKLNQFEDNIFINNNIHGDLSKNSLTAEKFDLSESYKKIKKEKNKSSPKTYKRAKSLELNDIIENESVCDLTDKGRFKGLKTLTSSINTKIKNSYDRITTKPEYHRDISKRVKKFKNTIKRKWRNGDTNSEINSSFDDYSVADENDENNQILFEKLPNELLLKTMNLQGSSKLWIGKDYCNFIVKDFDNLQAPFDNVIDRNKIPRMPWHDVAGCVCGPAARDIARHFIQRWNYTKTKKARNLIDYPLLLPKSYYKFKIPKSISSKCSNCRVQCLRSVSNWSGGLSYTEHSIHEAMKELIKTSKYYIYIENQFFISDNETTRNEISTCIFERIIRADQEKEKFKVYLFLPLVPGYEGEYGQSNGIPLHTITHYNNKSIRNLFKKLSDAKIEPINYICFFSLRTWSELNNKLVSELIYVHSKLMIVDDRACIIGSANINDRSFMGTRDSEFALVIEDNQLINGTMNKNAVQVGKFCSSLRKRLFREFLGYFDESIELNTTALKAAKACSHLNETLENSVTTANRNESIDITDPCSDNFYKNVLLKYAAINTKIYEDTFNVIPCDRIKSFDQLKEHKRLVSMSISNPEEAKSQLLNIKGYIVLYPSGFLECENLLPSLFTKERVLPVSLWT